MTAVATGEPVNAILIGYGYWGARFLGIAERVDKLRIIGVVDSHADDEGFDRPPSTPCGSDLVAALADPRVEAVIITTPASDHVEPARQALRAGKHVFTEKPFALTSRDTAELLNLARAGGLMVTVDHQYWWSAEVEAMRRALADDAVGAVVAVSVDRAANGPVRQDVGALWDLAVHDIAILARLGILRGDTGQRLRVEECRETMDGPVAGCVSLTGRTPTDVLLRLHACWISETTRRRLVVAGERGSLLLEENDGSLAAWLIGERGRELLSRTAKSDPVTPIERALGEFSDGARGRPDLSKAVDAGGVVAVVEQLLASARPVTTIVRSARCWL